MSTKFAIIIVIIVILSSSSFSLIVDSPFDINSEEWHCWSDDSCKCFINVTCNSISIISHQLVTDDDDKMMIQIWLRCYKLEAKDLILLKKFLQQSPRTVTESFDCRLPPPPTTTNIALRTDFLHCNSDVVNEFFTHQQQQQQQNHHHHHDRYWLKSLTIAYSDMNHIDEQVYHNFDTVETLNLTGNRLTEFDTVKMNISSNNNIMTVIDLSNNQLSNVNLIRLSSLKSINLSQNNLTDLIVSDSIKRLNNNNDIELNIGNNPWNCSHQLNWLVDLVANIIDRNDHYQSPSPSPSPSPSSLLSLSNRVDLFQSNEPECNAPIEAKMFPFSVWKSVQQSRICRTCSCYLKDKYAKVGYRYLSINCTNRGLVSLPSHLPKNTKILDLSGNKIRNLNPLSKYHHGELSKWSHINKIILSDNLLESLDGLESIRSIVFLDISGNLFTEIPYHIVNKVLSSNKIDKFRIGNNPYHCDCNTVKFQKWLQNNYRIILDIKDVRCGDLRPQLLQQQDNHHQFNIDQRPIIEQARQSKFFKQEILQINSVHLCPISNSVVNALDLINIILATTILLLIIKVGYDFIWQKRTGKLPRFFKLNI